VISKLGYGVKDMTFISAEEIIGINQLVEDFYQQMNQLPNAKVIRETDRTDLSK
jgi:hypothetical protein